MAKKRKYPPLHPARLAHPLERALREEWETMCKRGSRPLDILAGPTQARVPECNYDTCSLTGGCIPYPYGRMTERDRMVAAEMMQWLGTGVGYNLLCRAFKKVGGNVEFDSRILVIGPMSTTYKVCSGLKAEKTPEAYPDERYIEVLMEGGNSTITRLYEWEVKGATIRELKDGAIS